jgi:hypothetical protein
MNPSDTLANATPVVAIGPGPATSAGKQGRLRLAARRLHAREPRLAAYGTLLLGLLLPMALAWAIDVRMVQGANVWIKPMKFALSIAVFAFTTGWFIGHLPASRRRGRAVNLIVWLVIGSGTFELAYITLQAGLGEASHYNVGDPFHFAMYALMGIGATLLTATQPMLAWQLYRHGDAGRPPAYRQAVIIGLVLTFVFGAGVGGLLGGMEPPRTGPEMPLLGWSLQGGDLRPAHFLGIHAAQLLPLVGFVAVARRLARPRLVVWTASLLYVGLFLALVAWGLAGRS